MAQYNVEQATIQRFSTIDTKGGGYALLLTMGSSVADEVLIKLLHGRGSVMKLTLEDVQLSLLAGDDPNAGLPPTAERVWETVAGDVVKAHAYQSVTGGQGCDLCGHGETHEAHQHNELAEKLIAETPEQAEARASLASRSRSNRAQQ